MALQHARLALLAVLVCAAGAQPTTDDNTPAEAGAGIKVSFRPRVVIVVGIFTMIFSLTFLLLMYAKFCHPSSSPPRAGNDAEAVQCGGVPKQAIEALPFFRFATLRGARQGMECSVCLARFDDADLLRLLPRCRHAFHLDCVGRWLESNASCPLCRTRVDADDATLGLKYPSSARIVFGGDAPSSEAAASTSGRDLLDIFVERVPGPGPGGAGAAGDEEDTTMVSSSTTTRPPPELDRHRHRIIVSDVVFKSRWSELNSADLIALDTEMLRSMSSGRFVFAPDSPPGAANKQDKLAEEEEEVDLVVATERKRLLGPVVVVEGGGCSSSSSSVLSSGVRSMSELVSLPRLRAAARERLSEEENRRWLPIARRTARWFAGRASSREEERAVNAQMECIEFGMGEKCKQTNSQDHHQSKQN